MKKDNKMMFSWLNSALIVVFLLSLEVSARPCEESFSQDKNVETLNISEQAQKGDISAQVLLAKRHYESQSFREAFYWYKKAAEQGDAEAQYQVAHMYEFGKGIKQDFSKAVRWGLKAARQKHKKAQRYNSWYHRLWLIAKLS